MNAVAMDKKQISLIAGIVLSALIALAAVFGYDVTVVAPREQAANALSEQIVLDQAQQATLDLLGEAGGSRAVGDTNFTNLVASGDVTAVGTVTGAAGAFTTLSGTTVTVGGVALSGPVRFGSVATVVTGTLIAHSLATTPTAVLLTAGAPITTPLYITARNATSVTVGINDAVSVATVYWLAGK